MPFINFEGIDFTLITDKDENPWMIAKEVCDYLKRCPNTLGETRQVCVISEKKWHLFL